MSQVTRLQKSINPSRYALHFDIDLAGHRFIVDETITFTLVRKAKSLTFHGVGLEITKAWVDGSTKAKAIKADAATQTVRFEFASELAAGVHRLEVTAAGEIQESLHGLYRSQYEYQGATKLLAVTQFEAVHAREAFLCIDEPAAKSVFETSITTHDTLTVISNTQNVRELSLESGRVRHDFAPTPKMSTYLVAFVVGEFEYVQQRTKAGVTVRAYGTPGRKADLEFALETGVRALTFLADYFDLPYPLSKLDMVAIPDFGAGAMENWGLVTYRETALLLDPENFSLGNRQRVVEVIAHELAHQWFGNLVTMSWWNDLWLNEGFATWMEVFVQDHLYPEWGLWTQFTADHYARALELDGLANTHPIDVAVDDPRELDEIFDAVSYSKGGAIINMLYGYLGDQAFQQGLRLYLKQHAFGNTTTTDLWKALGKASKQPVAAIMNAWTGQPGYPIISFNGNDLSQSRFYSSPREAGKKRDQTLWPIPLAGVNAAFQPSAPVLAETEHFASPGTKMIKLNPAQRGFYRVLYTETELDALSQALISGALPVQDRFGIVNDVFATTEAGLSSSSLALKLTSLMRDEINFVVWSALADGFGSLLRSVEDEPLREQLKGYGRWLVQPNLERLGWSSDEHESYFDGLMRPFVMQQAIGYGDEAVVTEAQRRYKAGGAIDPNIRAAVYLGVARGGDEADFDRFHQSYKHEQNPQERMRLLNALCRFRQSKLNQRVLELGLSSDVRPQDSIYVLAWSLHNRDSRDLAWAFIQEHWSKLVDMYGGGGMILEYIPNYIGDVFATQQRADEVRAFFERANQPGLKRPAAQAVEAIELRADWFTRDQSKIRAFLASNPTNP